MHVPSAVACYVAEATPRPWREGDDAIHCKAFTSQAQMATLNGFACFRNGVPCARLNLEGNEE